MNYPHRHGLPPMPDRIRRLKVDERGYPVPFFVAYIDGKPDFRVIDPERFRNCTMFHRCWLCGQELGAYKAFVVGPMCAINRTSSEPPSHRECAEWAVKACPFLILPKAQRREANMPENKKDAPGFGLKRNPGVSLIWITKAFKPFRAYAGNSGVLFNIGEPRETLWYAEGRTATRAEVLESINTGLPALQEMADKEDAVKGGNRASLALQGFVEGTMQYLPKE